MADETKKAVDEVLTAFNEFKQTNDKALKDKADGKAVSDLDAKLDKINEHLDKFEPLSQKLTLAEQQNKAMQEQLDRVETILSRPGAGGDASKAEASKVRAAFDRAMRKAPSDRDPADVELVRKHMNALIKSDDSSAGYLLAPAEMQAEIIKDVIELTPMRALATVRTIGSGSLKQPKKVGSGSASRIGETANRTNTGDPQYGMLEILAPEMFARIEVSQQMLEDSEYDLEMDLADEAGIAFSEFEGNTFINGSGVKRARGILQYTVVANASYAWGKVGYVASGAAGAFAASNPGDALISLQHALKSRYRNGAAWLMADTTLASVRQMKDGSGAFYLWNPDPLAGFGGRLLGAPVEIDDYMPVVAANSYSVAFGNFRRAYTIVDRRGVAVIRDNVTKKGTTKFHFSKRVGGGIHNFEALKLMKFAAS